METLNVYLRGYRPQLKALGLDKDWSLMYAAKREAGCTCGVNMVLCSLLLRASAGNITLRTSHLVPRTSYISCFRNLSDTCAIIPCPENQVLL